jgi:hypothetical protein
MYLSIGWRIDKAGPQSEATYEGSAKGGYRQGDEKDENEYPQGSLHQPITPYSEPSPTT